MSEKWTETTWLAPDAEALVLVAYKNRHGAYDYDVVLGSVIDDACPYTHWMPLPKPPTARHLTPHSAREALF